MRTKPLFPLILILLLLLYVSASVVLEAFRQRGLQDNDEIDHEAYELCLREHPIDNTKKANPCLH